MAVSSSKVISRNDAFRRDTRGSHSAQWDLFPLKVVTFLPMEESVDAIGVATAEDTHRYRVKGRRSNADAPACEWLATRMAEDANIPCPTAKVLQMADGELYFGSREIAHIADRLETSEILTSRSVDSGYSRLPSLQAFLSSVYAFDMFISNVDRHDHNYISIDANGTLRFFAIDFATSLWGSIGLEAFPGPSHQTRVYGKRIRDRHGFDHIAAKTTLDRLSGIPIGRIESILNEIPLDWLDGERRREFATWWASPKMKTRIEGLKIGISNGSLL